MCGYSRKHIQHQVRESNAIRPNRIIHDLRRVQVKQRRPRDGVEALEEEHDGDVTIDEARRCPVRVVGVLLGQATDYEQAGDQ